MLEAFLFNGRMLAGATAVTGTAISPQANSPLLAEGDRKKKTVRANRRRRTTSGDRKQAPTPRRRRETPSRPKPGSSGGSGGTRPPRPTSGGLPAGLPGGGNMSPKTMLILLVLFVVCVLPLMLIFGRGGDDQSSFTDSLAEQAPITQPETESAPVELPTAEAFVPPPVSSEGQTWTVMLYQDADDKILEQDIFLDLNEAERIGSTERVRIVAQLDRYQGGFSGDGDWTGTRRYFVTQDNDLNRIGSQLIEEIPEANMADGQTLVDFVTWAIENYPADKYVLIMSDHGIGWPGGWSDPNPKGPTDNSIPLAAALGDELFLQELDDALEQIRAQTGITQFELVGMDACLMGQLEVFSALAPHARYAVASQEVEPALGWAYTGFLRELVSNPDMTGADLSRAIVESYIVEDQRIVDDAARQEMFGRGGLNGLFGLFGGGGGNVVSQEQAAAQLGKGVTITAVDLAAIPNLITAVNDFAYALQDESQPLVAQARNYAQSFTNVFGNNVPPSYIDLGNFVQVLQQQTGNSTVKQRGDAVMTALSQAIVAEKHGPDKPGASGVAFYFPSSQLYRAPAAGPQSYTAIASRFAASSLWDDFLAFHYGGRPFTADAQTLAVPDRADLTPGAGQVTVSPISLSQNYAAPGDPVVLSADVNGTNLGYIYLFVGYLDENSNSIFLADSDYLESADAREVDGIYYPIWPEGETFTLEFEWEPVVFAITDGQNDVVARFQPQSYGATFEEAIYTVDGIYTYADGETRYARLLFQNGVLVQVLGFTGQNGTGGAREIVPSPGDQFTVLEQWLDLDANGQVTDQTAQEGGTLTFSNETLTWVDLDAAPGSYVVGFIVTDLDGNPTQVVTPIEVR